MFSEAQLYYEKMLTEYSKMREDCERGNESAESVEEKYLVILVKKQQLKIIELLIEYIKTYRDIQRYEFHGKSSV